MKKIFNKTYAIYFLVFVFLIVQFNYYIISVKNFSWLAFLDHDTIYQVERFLLNINYPGIDRLFSMRIDYGSELYWLVPLFNIINIFSINKDPVNAYYFLSLFHLLFSILSLLLIRKIFYNNYKENYSALACIMLLITMPLYIIYAGFIKPDANLILFLLLLCIWYLIKFDNRPNNKILLTTILLISLGAAIKWWPIFMVFPLVYVIKKNFNINSLLFLKRLSFYSYFILPLLVGTISYYQIYSSFFNEMLLYAFNGSLFIKNILIMLKRGTNQYSSLP